MARWYPLEPVDVDFFASAPLVFSYRRRFAATPEQVWKSLTSNESVAAWGTSIKAITWTSPSPFGNGTTRQAAGLGGAALRERYFRWEEGHRHSFYAYEANMPFFKRFAEDYVVEPYDAATMFTWTAAVEPTAPFALPLKMLSPLLKKLFERIPNEGQRYFGDA
ncbi:SRPBCC family protein [Mycobacterium sp. GA-2829]|uniref:SRPBCC family protein n=1 Tax=Mycobacterium sp. GA-2829 TaxID=1772283 RepID=UPI00073FF22C|nr:SRPBCC family protein [Mycobacterium sp. GA-2829]KUI29288.1 polyketide cyclase [Mycobacterium sp. GA-2829]